MRGSTRWSTAKSRSVYVDTSAFVAFRDRSDTYHPRFVELFSNPPPLMTSAAVVVEGHAWFLRRFDIHRALEFLAFIESLTVLKILPLDGQDLREAEIFLRRFRDQDLTLVDAVGLALMERHRVATCWSTDRHMSLTGRGIVTL